MNAFHISRGDFPPQPFLSQHDRLVCSSPGCHWVYHRRFSRLGCQRRFPDRPDKCGGSLVPLSSLSLSHAPAPHNSPPPSPASLPPSISLPSWDDILGTFHPIVHHIPKSVRDDWAETVSLAFSNISANPSDPECWKLLFMLPRCTLFNPRLPTPSSWRDAAKTIRARFQRWRKGDYDNLWSEFVAASQIFLNRPARRSPSANPNPTRAANANRAKRAVEAGQFRKALQALSSRGLVPPSPQSLQEMESKHPRAPPPTLPSSPPPTPIQIGEEDVLRALHSFPVDSSPGPSLLTPTHLKEAVLCTAPRSGVLGLYIPFLWSSTSSVLAKSLRK